MALALAGFAFTSCDDEVTIDKIDEADYANITSNFGTLRDYNTGKVSTLVEMRDTSYETKVAFNLARAPKQGVDVVVSIDEAYLSEYNAEHGTSFKLYPTDRVSIQNSGKILVAPDEKVSYALDVVFAPADTTELEADATYVVPLKATASDGVAISEQEDHCIYLLKNLSYVGTADKGPDAKKVFAYFEVNDTNPLNVLLWEMEDGKLAIDFLVLFAANINYDREKGEVYVYNNENVQYCLDHYDEILLPLKKRGVKIILGLLGNHDESGLAQLSDIGAKDFAKKIADICYSYNLDGVNFDDEYSNSPDLSNPLFTSRSTEAGSRLMFETKKAMPDKYVTTFQYGCMGGSDYVDGIPAGEWLDIAVANYGGSGRPLQGMTRANCSYTSVEFARGGSISVDAAQRAAASDYGYFMIFAPWAANNEGSRSHYNNISNLCEGLYGVPLKAYPGGYYKKNSTEFVSK